MSDNEIVEIAKATSEVAKTGGKAIDATSAFGQFCDRVFGEGLVQGFGIVSDRVKYVRIKQAIKLEEKVTKLLEDAGVQKTQPVSPVIALPIFESATLEEDENLHTAWANLLATAMDPSKPEAKRSYSKMLSELEPFDVKLLGIIMLASRMQEHRRDISFYRHDLELSIETGAPFKVQINAEGGFGEYFEIFPDENQEHASFSPASKFIDIPRSVEISINNLFRVGILTFGVVGDQVLRHDGRQPSTFRGIDEFSPTALGIAFFEAVSR